MVGRNVAIALGIICIVSVAALLVVLTYYPSVVSEKDSTIASKINQIALLNSQISDLNNTISSLNSQISGLDFNVTDLQDQIVNLQRILNDLLNVTVAGVRVDDIALNSSAWLNKTVVVEGRLLGPLFFSQQPRPGNYVLCRVNETSESPTVFTWVSWSGGGEYDLMKAIVIGVVRLASNDQFYHDGLFIDAERVILP
jgi:hypothetical protein